jgi:hypothetical protein
MKIMVGLGTCGIAAGAEKTYESLEAKVAAAGLPVKIEKTG